MYKLNYKSWTFPQEFADLVYGNGSYKDDSRNLLVIKNPLILCCLLSGLIKRQLTSVCKVPIMFCNDVAVTLFSSLCFDVMPNYF